VRFLPPIVTYLSHRLSEEEKIRVFRRSQGFYPGKEKDEVDFLLQPVCVKDRSQSGVLLHFDSQRFDSCHDSVTCYKGY